MIRVNLEGLAIEAAAQAVSKAQLTDIVVHHDRFAREMKNTQPDVAQLIAYNKAFHFAAYRSAGLPTLLHMIEALWLRVGPILNYDLRSSNSRRALEGTAVVWHENLIQALMQRNSAAARNALRGDIESAAEYIVSADALISADADAPASTAPVAPKAAHTSKKKSAP